MNINSQTDKIKLNLYSQNGNRKAVSIPLTAPYKAQETKSRKDEFVRNNSVSFGATYSEPVSEKCATEASEQPVDLIMTLGDEQPKKYLASLKSSYGASIFTKEALEKFGNVNASNRSALSTLVSAKIYDGYSHNRAFGGQDFECLMDALKDVDESNVETFNTFVRATIEMKNRKYERVSVREIAKIVPYLKDKSAEYAKQVVGFCDRENLDLGQCFDFCSQGIEKAEPFLNLKFPNGKFVVSSYNYKAIKEALLLPEQECALVFQYLESEAQKEQFGLGHISLYDFNIFLEIPTKEQKELYLRLYPHKEEYAYNFPENVGKIAQYPPEKAEKLLNILEQGFKLEGAKNGEAETIKFDTAMKYVELSDDETKLVNQVYRDEMLNLNLKDSMQFVQYPNDTQEHARFAKKLRADSSFRDLESSRIAELRGESWDVAKFILESEDEKLSAFSIKEIATVATFSANQLKAAESIDLIPDLGISAMKKVSKYDADKDISYDGLKKLLEEDEGKAFPTFEAKTKLIKNWSNKANDFPFLELPFIQEFAREADWQDVTVTSIMFLDTLLKNVAKSDVEPQKVVELAKYLGAEDFVPNLVKSCGNKDIDDLNQLLESISTKMKFNSKRDGMSFLFSGITPQELEFVVKDKLVKSLKVAFKHPENYINGEIKDPASSKKEVLNFFGGIKNARVWRDVINASRYLDNDTFNQMMDKRFSLFEKSLENLSEVSKENLELLSSLIKCKRIDGKALTAKDKVELTKIIGFTATSRFDTSELKRMAKEGVVDIATIKEKALYSAFESLGLTPKDIAKIPKEKLNWNPDYAYTLSCDQFSTQEVEEDWAVEFIQTLRQYSQSDIEAEIKKLKKQDDHEQTLALIGIYENRDIYSDEEIAQKVASLMMPTTPALADVVKAAMQTDFNEFIKDTSNIYGQSNAKTKAAFEKEGLNYDKWLKPSCENNTSLKINGETLNIKMWDRNPQEDMFIGSKTTCCTALDQVNGGATPIYLANTAFNVVGLHNSEGEMVGMSRIFMAKKEGKPVLIMDNIELNNTYVKHFETKEKKKIRDSFFQYMNNLLKDIARDKDGIDVLFAAQYANVPLGELKKITTPIEFLGDVAGDKVYLNFIGNWALTSEVETYEKDLFIVPKMSLVA